MGKLFRQFDSEIRVLRCNNFKLLQANNNNKIPPHFKTQNLSLHRGRVQNRYPKKY